MDTVDAERLERLLGGADLATLRLRLRARYERGLSRDDFTLTDLKVSERRALAGLLGRRTVAADSMRIRRSELDAALARAGIAATLREALAFLDGPLADHKADRAAREQAWSAVLAPPAEPRLAGLVADIAGTSLVKRLCGSDPARAEVLLSQTARVLARLPGRGVSRAQLAAEVLGDSHGLDTGRPVATLVLKACSVEPPGESIERSLLSDAEESQRDRWARLGVTVNALALPALSLNLPSFDTVDAAARQTRASAPQIDASTPLDAPVALGLSPLGEPIHLSLRRLLRCRPAWRVAGRDVFVCENPNIVAIAADRIGSSCAPLVCTDGMPSAAQQTLLSQLAADGARLRYHGDFDWSGLVIGNFVIREFGAEPWRFGTADYLSAAADHGIPLQGDDRVTARWDDRLAPAMMQRRVVVHEEAVVESLLPDLAAILTDP